MKNFRKLILFAILFIGFNFQNCSCGGCAEIEGAYFDIKGFELNHFSMTPQNRIPEIINENHMLDFEEYGFLRLDFEVDYITSNSLESNTFQLDFSTMPSAYGCSCEENGEGGSKDEGIVNFQIITINDYNENYLAGTVVNDLFEATYNSGLNGLEALSSYSERNSFLVQFESIFLKPKIKPSLSNEFQFKIMIELSTGEFYEAITLPIILTE